MLFFKYIDENVYDWNYEALLFGIFFSLIRYDSASAIFINSSSSRKFNSIYLSKPWNYWLQCSLCYGVWKIREFYTSVETESKKCEILRHLMISFFCYNGALTWYNGISIPWNCIILPSYKMYEYRTICSASIGLCIDDITPKFKASIYFRPLLYLLLSFVTREAWSKRSRKLYCMKHVK